MEWVGSDNCLIENRIHTLPGSKSIYTELIRSEKFPSRVTIVIIEGQRSGYFLRSFSEEKKPTHLQVVTPSIMNIKSGQYY